MEIFEATHLTDEIFTAMQRLIPQLSVSPPPTRQELQEIIASPSTVLFLARHPELDHQIAGAAVLVLFRIPTGLRARIEDVVVDERLRRRGIGEALTHAALDYARSAGAPWVDLTSNPARLAANHLYQRMGFEPRQTNMYRYKLD
jgi:ribosomal protein S18 acetylase RimI-like enzyme